MSQMNAHRTTFSMSRADIGAVLDILWHAMIILQVIMTAGTASRVPLEQWWLLIVFQKKVATATWRAGSVVAITPLQLIRRWREQHICIMAQVVIQWPTPRQKYVTVVDSTFTNCNQLTAVTNGIVVLMVSVTSRTSGFFFLKSAFHWAAFLPIFFTGLVSLLEVLRYFLGHPLFNGVTYALERGGRGREK